MPFCQIVISRAPFCHTIYVRLPLFYMFAHKIICAFLHKETHTPGLISAAPGRCPGPFPFLQMLFSRRLRAAGRRAKESAASSSQAWPAAPSRPGLSGAPWPFRRQPDHGQAPASPPAARRGTARHFPHAKDQAQQIAGLASLQFTLPSDPGRNPKDPLMNRRNHRENLLTYTELPK